MNNDVDIVVEPRVEDELDRVAARVLRDLDTSCALVTVDVGRRRRLLASAGSHSAAHLRALRHTTVTSDTSVIRSNEPVAGRWAVVGTAHVAVRVDVADAAVSAVLWAVQDSRRWFDNAEVRHLRLLARRAAAVLDAEPLLVLEPDIDARAGADRIVVAERTGAVSAFR